MSKWIVHTKGGSDQSSFEIAVVREDNRHGISSYGWFDQNKLLISHNGGPCRWPVTKSVWGRLVAVAQAEADALNSAETT